MHAPRVPEPVRPDHAANLHEPGAAPRRLDRGSCAPAASTQVHYTAYIMLDLKAKLASAGLVSKEDVERVEREKARTRSRSGSGGKGKSARPAGSRGRRADAGSGLPVAKLQGKPKGEVYAAIRSWVEKIRIDAPSGAPSEEAQPFHFAGVDGKIGRLVLEPGAIAELQKGSAGLITYMSNHGRAHAVVPADGARAVAELFPEWLRVLEGDARAGLVAAPPAPAAGDEDGGTTA